MGVFSATFLLLKRNFSSTLIVFDDAFKALEQFAGARGVSEICTELSMSESHTQMNFEDLHAAATSFK